jgi:Ca-activated chloride channel family protein
MFEGRSATAPNWCVLPVCLLLAAFPQTSSRLPLSAFAAQDGSSHYVISEDVNLVVLPVTVRERNGRFVSGLNVSNFQVYEDGKLQKVTLFRDEDVPVTVGLVVDHSGSMAAKQLEVIEGAQAFVQASNPQDREFVVNFNSTVSFPLPENVAFTSNPDVLRAALSTPSASGKTALYDALAAAMEHFQNGDADKRVLLLISDGGDNASKNSFSQVFQMTQTANVMIYAIGLFDEHSADQNPKVLKKLAEETGGQAYFPTSLAQIVSVCREIAAEIRHQYTLGYSPADSGRSGYRKIHVSVTAPGRGKLSVRTRTGYFSPPQRPSQTAVPHGQGR